MSGDRVTEAMLPEFELPADVAMGSLELGISMEDVRLVYGFTAEQLEPYRAEWEQLQGASRDDA